MAKKDPEEELEEIKLKRAKLGLEREEEQDAREDRAEKEESKRLKKEYYSKIVGERGGNGIVFLALLLFIWDTTIKYKGFNITNFGSFSEYLGVFVSLGYVIGLWAFFYYFMSEDKTPKALISSAIAMAVIIFTFSLILRFTLGYDFTPFIHLIFILLLWMTFIREREDVARANIILIVFIFLDFYLFSVVNTFAPGAAQWLIGIPILFYLTLSFVYEKTNNTFAIILIFVVLIYYLITTGPALAVKLNMLGIEVDPTQEINPIELPGLFVERVISNPFDKVSDGFNAWLSGRYKYAITGKVEEYEHETIGVYLEQVKSAEPVYYDDEDVTVWGTVRARTLDDPINLQVGCFVKKSSTSKEKRADKVDPEKKFTVFTLEEKDFSCTFNKTKLGTGSTTITSFADFNFETEAKQKVYFINKETLRSMTHPSVNIDPFKDSKITDKNPGARFTAGPVKIEMGVSTSYEGGSLIGVTDTPTGPSPTLTIILKNNDGWQGKLDRLKEIVILTPKEIVLETTQGCNFNEDYGLAECQNSVDKFVGEPCNEVCRDNKISGEACSRLCEEKVTDGKKQCNNLFNEAGEEYNGFSIDLSNEREREYVADEFKTIRCRFKPTEKVLEGPKITTKFFRVKTRYNYTVEKLVTVRINKVPDEFKDTKIAPPTNLFVGIQNNKVILDWTLSVDDGSGGINDIISYNIYRKEKNTEYKRIINVPRQTKQFTDDKVNLDGEFEYHYYVEAVDNDDNKAKSVEKEISSGLLAR